ncbi:MAG: 3-oxoacyl-ACP synthase, partial [Algoriphagus sp. 32-45-6]
MFKSRILGAGHYVPERIVTNEELSQMMDTSNEWIVERTGIHERRWFTPGVDTVTNMSAKASRMAMERAGLEGKDIDFIVFATIT